MIAPTDVSQMSQLQVDEYEYNTGMCLDGLIYPGFMNNVIRLYIPLTLADSYLFKVPIVQDLILFL